MNVSDLQQSRKLGKGKVASKPRCPLGRKTTDCQRPTLSPREERVGREPERGDGFQKTPVFLSLVVISVMTFALLAPASAADFDQSIAFLTKCSSVT